MIQLSPKLKLLGKGHMNEYNSNTLPHGRAHLDLKREKCTAHLATLKFNFLLLEELGATRVEL